MPRRPVVNRGVWVALGLALAGIVIAGVGQRPLEKVIQSSSESNAVGQGIVAWLSMALGGGLILLSLIVLHFAERRTAPVVARGFDPSRLDSVRPGMSQAEVENELGSPIQTWTHRAPGQPDLVYLAYGKETIQGDNYYEVVVLSLEGWVVRTERRCIA